MDKNKVLNEATTLLTVPAQRKWYNKIKYVLILMVIPTVLYVIIFNYLPLGGLVIAFKDYTPFKGIFDSPWTSMGGFKHFYFLGKPACNKISFWRRNISASSSGSMWS